MDMHVTTCDVRINTKHKNECASLNCIKVDIDLFIDWIGEDCIAIFQWAYAINKS